MDVFVSVTTFQGSYISGGIGGVYGGTGQVGGDYYRFFDHGLRENVEGIFLHGRDGNFQNGGTVGYESIL